MPFFNKKVPDSHFMARQTAKSYIHLPHKVNYVMRLQRQELAVSQKGVRPKALTA